MNSAVQTIRPPEREGVEEGPMQKRRQTEYRMSLNIRDTNKESRQTDRHTDRKRDRQTLSLSYKEPKGDLVE